MDSKVLLSQAEIDVLVQFLNDSKIKVGEEVLEQSSVDKLLHIIKAGGRKINFDTVLPSPNVGSGTAFYILEDGSNVDGQQENCELKCVRDQETGHLRVICQNKHTGREYAVTPAGIEQLRCVKDDHTSWGYAVAPITFDNISILLQVKYAKETFDFVCNAFVKNLYGDENTELPSVYMPDSLNLIQHLL